VVPGIPPISKIVCGTNHTLAIDTNGQLFGWGSNSNMQISHGEEFSKAQNPLICSYSPLRITKNLENNYIKDVSGG
jgi:alpha-tubulin suppressor-like RCC1 family protein